MPSVIEMYEDRSQQEVFEFVAFQMKMHHPGGVKTVEEGIVIYFKALKLARIL